MDIKKEGKKPSARVKKTKTHKNLPKPKKPPSASNLFCPENLNKRTVFEEPPQVLHLPPFETEYEILDRYWLTPPYAYANIYRDGYDNVHYQMVEPKLNEKELVVLEETFEHLRSMLVYDTVRKRGELELDPVPS